jgi:hypothetical protein
MRRTAKILKLDQYSYKIFCSKREIQARRAWLDQHATPFICAPERWR